MGQVRLLLIKFLIYIYSYSFIQPIMGVVSSCHQKRTCRKMTVKFKNISQKIIWHFLISITLFFYEYEKQVHVDK